MPASSGSHLHHARGSQRSESPPGDRSAKSLSPPASPARGSAGRKTWQQSTLPGASPGLTYTFLTHVVGRQFQRPQQRCADGDVVSIAHEPDNPRDRWALLVSGVAAGASPLGHLPADVAKWLAPLLTGGFVVLGGVIMEDSVSAKAPVLISIKVRSGHPDQQAGGLIMLKHVIYRKRAAQNLKREQMRASMLQFEMRTNVDPTPAQTSDASRDLVRTIISAQRPRQSWWVDARGSHRAGERGS